MDADPTRVVQAVANLLANAAKFTNRGGKVDVKLRAEGRQAVLSVRDNGIGIPAEAQQYLFAPFRQAPQRLPEDLRRAAEAGFHTHLVKPPNLEELQRLIDEECEADVPADVGRPS